MLQHAVERRTPGRTPVLLEGTKVPMEARSALLSSEQITAVHRLDITKPHLDGLSAMTIRGNN